MAVNFNDSNYIKFINKEALIVGSLVIGYVTGIRKDKIHIQLPDFRHAISENDDDMNILDKSTLLNRLVSCVVISNSDIIKVSIHPHDVNQSMEYTDLHPNDIIWGKISIKEDFGYTIDLGINIIAFLPTDTILSVGGYKFFTILKVDQRIIQLKMFDNKSIGKQITPGNKVECKITKHTQYGSNVNLSNDFNGYINPLHCNKLSNGEIIKATILLVSPNKRVFLTFSNIFDDFSNLSIGNIIKASLHSTLPSISIFTLKKGRYAICHKNDYIQDSNEKSHFTKFRVKDVDHICGFIKISNDPQFLALKYINIIEIEAGQLVKGIVSHSNEYGVEIRISKYLTGFIYKYLIGNIEFIENDEISCRVLYVNTEKHKIILTSNPILVDSSLCILKSYEVESYTQWYLGYVEKCTSSYVIVKFYNNVSGLLHITETDFNTELNSCFNVGQIVNVRVISSDMEHHRLVLSTRSSSPNTIIPIIHITNANYRVIDDAFSFEICKKDTKLTLSQNTIVTANHLSDFPEFIPFIKKIVINKPNVVLTALYMGKHPIMPFHQSTLKYSILRNAELHKFVRSVDEISINEYFAGFISKIKDSGLNIDIGLNIVGFLPKRTNIEQIGESILVRVKEYDHVRNRIILANIGLKDTFDDSSHLVNHGLCLSYLKELQFITNHLYSTSKTIEMGKVLNIEIVSEMTSCIYSCQYGDTSSTLFASNKYKFSNGDKIDAICVYWDLEPLHFYFILIDNIAIETDSDVWIVKNFTRFSIGFTETNTKDIVFIITNKTVSDCNTLKENTLIECLYISKFNNISFVSPKSLNSYKSNRIVSCCITKITPTYVQIKSPKFTARIHVSTISSSFQDGDRPLDRFKLGDSINAFMIPSNRKSRLHPHLYDFSFSSNSTILTPEQLIPGTSVIVFIRAYQNRHIRVEVNSSIGGLIKTVELIHINNLKLDPIQKYPPGTALKVNVVSFSLDLNTFLFSRHQSSSIDINDVTIGRVYNHDMKRHSLLLDLPNSCVGHIHITNIAKSFTPTPFQNFPIGTCVQCKVIDIIKPKCFILSIKHLFNTFPVESLVENKLYESFVMKITKNSIKITISEDIKGHVCMKTAHTQFGIGWNKNIKPQSVLYVKLLRYSSDNSPIFSLVGDQTNENMSIDNIPNVDDEPLLCNQSFDWKTGEYSDVTDTHPLIEAFQSDEEFIDVPNKPLTELEIRKIEQKLASNKLVPTTCNDFERLIVSSPNSSIVWINYICFYLYALELEKARLIFERALKTISFREVDEIINVYLCALNMECLYGTKEALNDIRTRAYGICKKKKVIAHMAELYQNLSQNNEAEMECNLLKKLFPLSKKSYILYGKLLASQHRFIETKNVLKDALKHLIEQKHTQIVLQFALLEFRFGDVERGCNLIESIINNYPHRVDVWFTYIDQLVKNNSIQQARICFERLSSVSLKKSKQKSIFNKFLSFERKYGDENKIYQVEQLIKQSQ